MRRNNLIMAAGFLLASVVGYLVARSAAPEKSAPAAKVEEPPKADITRLEEAGPEYRKGERPAFQSDREALEAGALVGQRSLMFKDRAALEAFLAKAGNRVKVIGRIDALNALRISFLNLDDLKDLLDGTEGMGMIFPAFYPENETVDAQAGAVAMGNSLLRWLGITGDNSQAGNGVKIAVLDTGVYQHPSFGGKVVAMGAAGDVNGHGTAVAGMIAANASLTPGVAPKSTILSYQIADAEGYSDSFKIAEAIIAAIADGANIINISLGSKSQSELLSAAVTQAINAGIVVVAASGNAGLNQVYYPAGDQGVVAVGAVDRNGSWLAFSNAGDSLDVAAPGYGLNAAWLEDSAVTVSGTSFSSPIIAGLIAKTMSESGGQLNAQQAWALIQANLNDTGAPGYDSQYGGGLPDMSRVASADTRGIYDAAVASQWVVSGNGKVELQVTIQNRGTETLINAGVDVTTLSGRSSFNVTTLKAGAIQTFTLPLAERNLREGTTSQFSSEVTLSGSQTDSKPSNNRRVEIYTVPSK